MNKDIPFDIVDQLVLDKDRFYQKRGIWFSANPTAELNVEVRNSGPSTLNCS